MVVGLDVHKKKTVGFVATGTIERGEWFECATTKEGLEGILPMLAGHKVLVEASTSGKAVVRLLRQHGADVDLVQPDVLTSMMRKTKSDKIDARDLTRVGLIGGYSTCYIPTSEEEALRSVTRHMQTLTEKATRLKNEIHPLSVKAERRREVLPNGGPCNPPRHRRANQLGERSADAALSRARSAAMPTATSATPSKTSIAVVAKSHSRRSSLATSRLG